MSKIILLYDNQYLMEFPDFIFAVQFMESLPRQGSLVFHNLREVPRRVGVGSEAAMQIVAKYWEERGWQPTISKFPPEMVHSDNTHQVTIPTHAPVFIDGSQDVPEPPLAQDGSHA